MLLGVLPFVDLAGGVVSFAHPTSIRHCCRAQNTITANSLQKNKQQRKKQQQFTCGKQTTVQQITTAEYPFSSKSRVNILEQEAVQISWRSALQHFNIKLQIGGKRFNWLPHTARRYRHWNCPASTECRPSPCWPGRRRSRSLQRSSTACTHLDLEGSKTNTEAKCLRSPWHG